MRVPIIQSIDSLKLLPVFPDATSVRESPRLRKFTLIYGLNGCGKTTLSRVFACMATGVSHEGWSPDSSFSVSMTDGVQVTQAASPDVLKPRILVFNVDFIANNFRWKEGSANPIFYIGQDQKNLSYQVESTVEQAKYVQDALKHSESRSANSARAFTQYKRDLARLIANELDLDRRYNASHLSSDYDAYTYAEDHLLDEADRFSRRQVLRADAPLPKLSRISEQPFDIAHVVRKGRNLLETTLGRLSIDTLNDHDAMLTWVKQGLEYHNASHLSSCLLCGNRLTEERINALQREIDSKYDDLIADVTATKDDAEALRDTLAEVQAAIPTHHAIDKNQQRPFFAAAQKLRSLIDEAQKDLDIAVQALIGKLKRPNSDLTPDNLPTPADATTWMSRFIEAARALNDAIDAHNASHHNFTATQNNAKNELKRHYLADSFQEYHELRSETAQADREARDLRDQTGKLAAAIDALKRRMRQHSPAADHVNRMIHKHLGHSELGIAAKDEGYEIRRNGKATTAAPSEGEKTAIALSYFLVLLEAEGRKREQLIVVMDDPVSSMDTGSMNYVCSLVRSLGNVAQLIILTHNAHVMNELKKWLKNRTEREMEKRGKSKDDASAALLFLDTVQPDGAGSRRSRIVELPRHLRDYESEYHYLFHLVIRFLSSEDDKANYFFVIPNVLRKVLEVYLAFKRPGPDGLSSKINALARRADSIGIDSLRLLALERLAHVESHSDNLDDLVTVSSMTIEEATDCASALLELVDRMDPEHSKLMRRQCGVNA